MPADVLHDRIRARLESRRNRQILRRLSDPTDLIDFSSNDYLGLTKSPELREKFIERLALTQNILGAGGSRLLDGNTAEHIGLENRLARFFRAPAALFHSSGYDANVGFFTCVPHKDDTVLYDALIHASVHDGMRASRVPEASRVAFEHNSIASLRHVLSLAIERDHNISKGKCCVWVAVEALYSMDGDVAPLDMIVNLVETMLPLGNGHIIVDEAHSTGVYGPEGRGLVALLGLEGRISVRLHTFGKALASNGAVILTTPLLREYLVNYSRPLIYTTALASYNAIAVQCSVDIIQSSSGERLSRNLLELAAYFRTEMQARLRRTRQNVVSLPPLLDKETEVVSLVTPIVPLLTSHPRELSQYLKSHCGILARPITHPTVPKGEERVRVCIHANNTREEVDKLLAGVCAWIALQTRDEAVEQGSAESVVVGGRARL